MYPGTAAAFPRAPEIAQILPQEGVFPPDPAHADSAGLPGRPHGPAGPVEPTPFASGLEHYLSGLLLQEDGKYADAVRELAQAWRADSSQTEVPVELARCYLELDAPDSASRWIASALRRVSDDPDVWMLAGTIDLRQGRPDSALVRFGRAAGLDPTNPSLFLDVLGQLEETRRDEKLLALIRKAQPPASDLPQLRVREAEILNTLGRIDEEIVVLAGILERDPDLQRVEGRLLQQMTRSSDPKPIAPALEELLKEQPGLDRVRVQFVRLLLPSEMWETSIPHLQILRKGHDTDAPIANQLGLVLFRAGRLDESQREFEAGAALAPNDPEPLRWLWRIAVRLDRADEALALAGRVLALTPADAEGRALRALALYRIGQPDAALAAADSAVAIDPARIDAGLLAAALVGEKGDHEGALRRIRPVAAAHPEDREAQFRLGLELERTGRVDSSLAVFDRILKTDPDDAATLNYAGYMCIDRGIRLEEAMARVKRALQLQPDNPAYLDSYGWGLFRSGKPGEALEPLRRAVDLAPKEIEILKHLGQVQEAAGNKRDAAATYRRALGLAPQDTELSGWLQALESTPAVPRPASK